MKRSLHKFYIFAVLIIACIIFCIWQNNSITISESDYINSKIPDEFNDFIIVHISDLHNKQFGKNQKYILTKFEGIAPNAIVITGDLVDRRKYDLDKAMAFVEGALDIAPVFYVSGNHEAWSGKYSTIKSELEDAGVHVLDNGVIRLSIGDSSIHMFGVRDPDFHTSNYLEGTDITEMTDQFKKWSSYKSFKILLSHRPELFDLYCENKMDLIFTGHAHGGQVRIPFIGGLVAPDQGLFPKYTSGYYTKDESTMFVSRGLGNSIIPIRIFNRPEIVVVTLKTKE
ncbi:MAG: metallophosphoesterase [Clostridiales bacterium]|jgi:predicted MPP superfamily phosphohydrolase|nr:metallophosphoesterase [Clostridiales bacterium]